MKRQFWYSIIASITLVLSLMTGPLHAAEETDSVDRDYKNELPRIPGSTPEEALAQFSLIPGYRIEVVAAEPLVIDPIAMAFDEQGRMFVVEMRGYSEMRDTNTGRIRMLTDTDGDGVYDKADTYVDGLAWPTAVACYNGGVFVAVAPDLRYYKDTDGDGKADEEQVLYKGFGLSNVQGLVNTLKWSFDNRLHGATSSSGAELRPADVPDADPLMLNGRDFSINAAEGTIRPESGGAQHGLSFDQWGYKFVCSNSDHIQQVMYEDQDIARNPYLAAPNARVSIAKDGPAAEVYRTSPVEPWRIVRTRLRIKKLVPGPIEGGGRAAGYFTGSTGVTIYRGDAMPELYGQAFIGDVGGNLMHRKSVDRSGLVFEADRVEEKREFLSSSDIWFRPCQFNNGPEGALYIADMSREVIEHPLSLPPMIKKYLDLNNGNDKGRIYRIVPEDFEQPEIPNMSEATSAELVAWLDHGNAWHRITAARLLYERQDHSVVPALITLADEGTRPEGRIRARYMLSNFGALDATVMTSGMEDAHEQVRRHSLMLMNENLGLKPELAQGVLTLSKDPSVHVRYEAAYASSFLATVEERSAVLAAVLSQGLDDRWISLAALSASYGVEGTLFNRLLTDDALVKSSNGQKFLETLALQTGRGKLSNEITSTLLAVNELSTLNQKLAGRCMQALQNGYTESGGGTLPLMAAADGGASMDEIMKGLLESARTTAQDTDAPIDERVSALTTLGNADFDTTVPILVAALTESTQPGVQAAALNTLRKFNDASVPEKVLGAWSGYSPHVQAQALDVLFARSPWTVALLKQIEDGTLSGTVLDSTRLDILAQHKEADVREAAQRIAASRSTLDEAALNALSKKIMALESDSKNGQVVFRDNCMSCHKLGTEGFILGPDLSTVGQGGSEKILNSILAPNMEVNPQYLNYLVETKDWESYSGVIVAETATSITLKRANGESDTLLRVNIESIQSTGRTLMPEDWEVGLGVQGLADVVAFLSALQ